MSPLRAVSRYKSCMRLNDIISRNQAIPVASFSLHPGLSTEIQDCLTRIGILDPPSDGKFGPVSKWALATLAGVPEVEVVDARLAARLLTTEPLPVSAENDLVRRLLEGMRLRNSWLARARGCINIVYVEGMGPDGTPNQNTPNQFNDARFALRVSEGGVVRIAGAWEATTEPGRKFTVNPENPDGAARISFGQFKAWCVGNHKNNPAHEALVQTQPIPVFRDRNKDFRREGDLLFSGLFGINQHHGFDYKRDDIRDASAGCLVGRLVAGHRDFMKIVKNDPRFLASRGYTFLTTVIPSAQIG